MTPAVQFVLYLLALLCFLAAAARMDGRSRIPLVPLGLALVVLVWVIQSGQAAF